MPYYGYYYGADLGYYAVVLASIVLGGLTVKDGRIEML